MRRKELVFTIDGCILPKEKIEEIEQERILHVMDEMRELGGSIYYKGQIVSEADTAGMNRLTAKEALIETKLKLGREGILALYKDRLEAMDQLFMDAAARSEDKVDFQPCYVTVKAYGLSLLQFMMTNQKLNKTSDERMAFTMHPEHFVFRAIEGGQEVMETIGMYKDPTFCKLSITADRLPVPLDADTDLFMTAAGSLISNGERVKVYAMHQFKDKPDGLEIKLGMFLPSAAPKEIAEGHKYHFAVEFTNVLEAAYEGQVKGNPLVKLALAIKKHQTHKLLQG